MATKGERQALFFLAAVALLGAGTRACRARQIAPPSADLDRQIEAVEKSGGRGHGRGNARRSSSRKRGRGRGPDTVARAVDDHPSVPEPPVLGPHPRLDLDVATPGEVEALPGIGPALAKRIVANREATGAFGCLAALDAVKGIGPATLRRLDSLVTFSGAPRAPCSQR